MTTAMYSEESLVLRPQCSVKKQNFLSDLIAFVFYLKGQCPSLKEVEVEVKNLQAKCKRKSEASMRTSKGLSSSRLSTNRDSLKVDRFLPGFPAPSGSSTFACYSSPVECKSKKRSKQGLNLGTKLNVCENEALGFKKEAKLKGSSETKGLGLQFNSENSIVASKPVLLAKPKPTLSNIKQNAQQERMLGCLHEVVTGVLRSAAHCRGILLAFGPSLLSLTQALLVDFVAAGDGEFGAADACDDDARASKQIFAQLMTLASLADAIPLTSMHVLLKAAKAAPPFVARPQFRLRPNCRVSRVTLPDRSARAQDAAACVWFHSATPITGYSVMPP